MREFPKLEQVHINGSRYYITPDGNRYPSITSVVGIDSKDKLKPWIDAVGKDEADIVSKRAASRGTRIHWYCEQYLLGNKFDVSMFDLEVYNQILPELKNITNIQCLETRLYSDYLRVAGTVDCIGYYKGKLSVIDFKTSSRDKDKSEIPSYFEQTSSYAVCYEELTGEPINNLVIIMSNDCSRNASVFIEKRDNYIKSFIKKRKQFRIEKGI